MGNYSEAERELVAYFSDAGGGYWPSSGGYEPRTQTTIDPGASMAALLDNRERAASRQNHRDVGAALAVLPSFDRMLIEVSYTPRQQGNGAMMACLMASANPGEVVDDALLSPYRRPLANLAPYTDSARLAYESWLEEHLGDRKPAVTIADIVRWLDDEARGPRAREVFAPIRAETEEILDALLAAYEVERRARLKAARRAA